MEQSEAIVPGGNDLVRLKLLKDHCLSHEKKMPIMNGFAEHF